MNTTSQAARVLHERKIHYVDESIQQALLVGLVLLEVALAAGLAWLMWQHLNTIVEDNLYRIHLADAQPILSQLLQEAARLLGIFVVVNVVALVLVHFLWQRHVRSILLAFGQLMAKTHALDYSADASLRGRHQLLDLTEAQRELDRQRLSAVRTLVQQLPAHPAANSAAVMSVLAALDDAIPEGRASRPERRVKPPR
ncbi:MAG: hypothetical protein GW848_10745 [Rhodoferax sp.]|nr:hypothetical protein [Rhodoferax sp.]PIW08609.1 MAG: hypothetical protein COW39_09095 [Comamonadaceae bacterium CG17_big_fil_post_rev_8_21_14_2_50_60_13]PJC14726.1 MAG: hypothetical protein CO066_05570 [Comamonadaceae bacterium CG_4_9_14_0_8_um_filter_60_18]